MVIPQGSSLSVLADDGTQNTNTIATLEYPLDGAPGKDVVAKTLKSEHPFVSASNDETGITEVEVSAWESTNYDATTVGTYEFTPILTEGSASVSDAVITVNVTKNKISRFDTTFEDQTYEIVGAPSADAIKEDLPKELEAVVNSMETTVDIVSWETDYDPTAVKDYAFTPVIDEERYELTGEDVSVPALKVSVTKSEVTSFEELDEQEYELGNAPTAKEAEEMWGDVLYANVGGETVEIEVTGWETKYNSKKAGEHEFTPVIDKKSFNELYELDNDVSLPVGKVILVDVESNSNGDGANDVMPAEITESHVTPSSVKIQARLVSGAKQTGSDYVWTPANSNDGHGFMFRVISSFSGTKEIEAATVTSTDSKNRTTGVEGGIQIKIPLHVLVDKKGEHADTLDQIGYPSQDDLLEMSEADLEDAEWAYFVDDENEEIVVYNRLSVEAGKSYSFDVVYATSKKTYYYYDYGHKKSGSEDFFGTILVNQGLSDETSVTSNKLKVHINTTAEITSTYKNIPTNTRRWNSSWGDKPSDADKYWWQYWEVRTDITDDPTQYYDFTLEDKPTATDSNGKNVACDVYAIRMSGGTWKLASDPEAGHADTLIRDGYRYDYVLTRIPKDSVGQVTYNDDGTLKTISSGSFTIKNTVVATVTPVDEVDEPTSAKYTRTFSWTLPTFEHPTGAFYMIKYGDENWEGTWNGSYHYEREYSNYDLDQFQATEDYSSEISDLEYAVWAYGYPYPWTLADGAVSSDYDQYGVKKVTYDISDSQFYPLNSDGTDLKGTTRFEGTAQPTSSDLSNATPLSSDDYDITDITYNYYFRDVAKVDGKTTIDEDTGKFNFKSQQATSEDVFNIYTKTGTADYVLAATYNLGTGETTFESGSLVTGVTDSKITFAAGVDGFRITTSNAYYYSNFCFYPHVTIFRTEDNLTWTGSDASKNSKDAVILKNVANTKVYDSDGIVRYEENKMSGDRIRRSIKASEISKTITGASNIVKKKNYNIIWRVNANETYITGSGKSNFLSQDGGTFYDLLPAGSMLQDGSVMVLTPSSSSVDVTSWNKYNGSSTYLSDSEFEVTTKENYRGSGRTLLVVKINTPGLAYTVFYTTVHPWDSVQDYGKNVLNPVSYETGNKSITWGFPDDPNSENKIGGKINTEEGHSELSGDNLTWYANLDSSTDDYKFIYDEAKHDIVAAMSASAGLTKKVMNSTDSNWLYTTTVEPDEVYRYRLRFKNSATDAKSKGLIMFDTLENFYKSDDAENEGVSTQSDWKGTLTAIDVTQMKQLHSASSVDEDGNPAGPVMAPVVYVYAPADSTLTDTATDIDMDDMRVLYSNYEEVLEAAGGDIANIDASKLKLNTQYWTSASDVTDLSKVKAIAIDMRWDANGNEFLLGSNASATATLYMKAPHGVTAGGKKYPETWNNIYIQNSQSYNEDGSDAVSSYIHQNYTTVKFKRTAGFGVHKVSAKEETLAISGISFRLYGTSSYGTEVDKIMTTDSSGNISYKKIEVGDYILQEYQANDDWLLDSTEHTVFIKEDGTVLIDGKDYSPDVDGNLKSITIKDNPRVHNDITFYKKDLVYTTTVVPGATFMLRGTSDYGTDVFITAISDEKGVVQFKNIEKGTYSLVETSAPDGYVLDKTEYTVIIDSDAIVSISQTGGDDIYR